MKINTKAVDKQWCEMEGTSTSFLIRPYPLSLTKWDENKMIELLAEQYEYCLIDWKGLVDENNKELKCTPKNKKIIFDFANDVREFVFEEAQKLAAKVTGEVKN